MNICQNWKYNFQKFSMAAFCVYKRRTCVMIFLAFNWSRLMGFLLYHFHNVSAYWHIKNCYKVPRWCQEAKGNTQNTLYHCQYLVVNQHRHFYCLTSSLDQCWMILTKILYSIKENVLLVRRGRGWRIYYKMKTYRILNQLHAFIKNFPNISKQNIKYLPIFQNICLWFVEEGVWRRV